MAWNYQMRAYMKEHLTLYIFVSVLFVMGIVFGSLMVNALSPGQKEEIARHVASFVQNVNQSGIPSDKTTFVQSFSLKIKWVALIWVLGLSMIGLPFILLLDFLKGVLIGFSVGYLVSMLSWKGMLFALVSVAPQNLVVIPALVICSVSAVSFSLHLIKNRLLQKRGTIYPQFIRYCTVTLCMAALLFGVSLFEAYVSPAMIRWVTPLLPDAG